jgi:hypothetical protein
MIVRARKSRQNKLNNHFMQPDWHVERQSIILSEYLSVNGLTQWHSIILLHKDG